MGVGGQLHALAALLPGMTRYPLHCINDMKLNKHVSSQYSGKHIV
jgi:exopolyphosphatase/pppGpp-phosphohydrolase